MFGRSFARRFPSSRFGSRNARFGAAGLFASVLGAGCVTVFAGSSPATPPFDYKAVTADIQALLEKDLGVGPVLVRLAWHQAGTWDVAKKDGGANSGSMRFAPECKHGANAGLLTAQALLEPIKKKHPGIAYGDLWSLAACLAIDAMGGPVVPWRWGRTEAKSPAECAPDGRLPDAAQGADHIRQVFRRMGFTDDKDMVALIGAHTIGECHRDRSGYVGPWTHDRLGFDSSFFSELLESEWIVDKRMPKLQFTDVATRKLMMLPSDMWLVLDPAFKKHVAAYAKDQDKFHADFAKAFQRLMEVGGHTLHAVPK